MLCSLQLLDVSQVQLTSIICKQIIIIPSLISLFYFTGVFTILLLLTSVSAWISKLVLAGVITEHLIAACCCVYQHQTGVHK